MKNPLLVAYFASVPFIVILFTRPVLRRTAWRNASQRPREAMLVALGSLLGAAIITGSFVVHDTFDHSISRRVYRDLGTIDEVAAFPDRASWDEGSKRMADLPTPLFDGTVPIGMVSAPVSTIDGPLHSAPQAQLIEVSFDRARQFGPPSVSGIVGATPGPGEVALSRQAADRLHVGAGGRVRVYAYGTELDLTVVRVLPQVGLAGLRLAEGIVADNLLVAPGTVTDLAARAEGTQALELVPPTWMVAVSNFGGVVDGVDATDLAMKELRANLQGIDVDLITAKRDALASAVSGGDFLGQYLNAMGAFGVLAGVLLLVNVFVMMGEERLPELGSMRAVGMNRWSVVAVFSTEGWIYSVAGCAAGAFAGIGLGRAMVALVGGLYQAEDEAYGLSLRFAARSISAQKGFMGGLVVSIIAVVLTSVRISRLDVISALRNLPPNRRRHGASLAVMSLAAFLVGVGALVTGAGFAAGGEVATTVGPVMMMFGAVPLLRRAGSTRTLVSLAALGTVLWTAVGRVLFGPAPQSPPALVSQGLCMVAAAVVLVTLQQYQLGRLLRRIGSGRRGVTARLALAYPLARPVRTALTLAPFCLVVFTLAFIASLSTLFTSDLRTVDKRSGGGYNAVITSSPANPVPMDKILDRPEVDAAAPLARVDVAFVASASNHPLAASATGFDERFLAGGRAPALFDRGTYRTDAEAYRAVIRDPDLIIVESAFLSVYAKEKVGPMTVGRTLTILDPITTEAREVQIAAVANTDIAGNGALYGKQSLARLVGGRAVTNRAFLSVRHPAAFTAAVERDFVANGANVETLKELGKQILDYVVQLVNVYWTYLGVGLVVGVAGVAVMMVRAVRERRRQIGVLRSIGFESGMVGRSFMLEATFIAVQAVVLGLGLAVATVFSITHSAELRDFLGIAPHFTLAVRALAALGGITIVAAMLATFGPSRAAAAIPPSEALRLVD